LLRRNCTLSNVENWWSDKSFTGDNTREQPYAYLLPRLTTKSNTYTVYYRVQALKQVPAGRVSNADWQRWNETTDQILSEYRGSATIERYIDSSQTIPDFALPANSNKNLAPYYRWRTVSQRQFVP
jgi:hypothetical protein